MNNSGRSVQAARDFFRIEPDQILVICDDFNLNTGQLRLRKSGSAGGQKGLDDILKKLATQDVNRLRIGIGRPPANWDVKDYVLSSFEKDEQDVIDAAVETATQAAESWVTAGMEAAMNQFNNYGKNTERDRVDPADGNQTAPAQSSQPTNSTKNRSPDVAENPTAKPKK